LDNEKASKYNKMPCTSTSGIVDRDAGGFSSSPSSPPLPLPPPPMFALSIVAISFEIKRRCDQAAAALLALLALLDLVQKANRPFLLYFSIKERYHALL
jgi:hypothetical protein